MNKAAIKAGFCAVLGFSEVMPALHLNVTAFRAVVLMFGVAYCFITVIVLAFGKTFKRFQKLIELIADNFKLL